MAVIIKDVEMPKSCYDCFAYDDSYDCCRLYSNGVPEHYNLCLLSERPEWCELKEDYI